MPEETVTRPQTGTTTGGAKITGNISIKPGTNSFEKDHGTTKSIFDKTDTVKTSEREHIPTKEDDIIKSETGRQPADKILEVTKKVGITKTLERIANGDFAEIEPLDDEPSFEKDTEENGKHIQGKNIREKTERSEKVDKTKTSRTDKKKDTLHELKNKYGDREGKERITPSEMKDDMGSLLEEMEQLQEENEVIRQQMGQLRSTMRDMAQIIELLIQLEKEKQKKEKDEKEETLLEILMKLIKAAIIELTGTDEQRQKQINQLANVEE